MNIAIVAQAGRIGYQAVLCAASIRRLHPNADTRIFVCVPQNSRKWKENPAVDDPDVMRAFERYGCEIVPIDNARWGSAYPHANKIYAVLALPPDEPFLFLDSDTIIIEELSYDALNLRHPALWLAGNSWPEPKGHSIGEIWRSLYAFFGIDSEPYRNPERTDTQHRCYPYYNAGVVYFERAGGFGREWLAMSTRLWDEQPPALAGQILRPFLDQITLPLVLAKFGVLPSNETDPIHENIIHYHFPFYLQVRHQKAGEIFAELVKDPALSEVLSHDEGFKYFMSDEAKRIVDEVHAEVWGDDGPRSHQAFKSALRKRVPFLR